MTLDPDIGVMTGPSTNTEFPHPCASAFSMGSSHTQKPIRAASQAIGRSRNSASLDLRRATMWHRWFPVHGANSSIEFLGSTLNAFFPSYANSVWHPRGPEL